MLKEKLNEELKIALRTGNTRKRLVLGMLSSAVKNRELEKRSRLAKQGVSEAELASASELTDEEILETIASEAKKRKESVASFSGGGRPEMAREEEEELAILMQYLPEQMTEDQVRQVVQDVVAQVKPRGLSDVGKVIGQVMARVKGRADGALASQLVKEALS